MMNATEEAANFEEGHQQGFSLLELLIAIVILAVVVAVIVSGVTQLQKTNTNQAVNVDLTQQSRQFMDQVVADLHQAGFPNVAMFDLATSTANPNLTLSMFKQAVSATWVTSQKAEMQQDFRAAGNLMIRDISMAGSGSLGQMGLASNSVGLPFGTGILPVYPCSANDLQLH